MNKYTLLYALDTIKRLEDLFDRAGDLFNSIDPEIREAFLNYHSEHFTLDDSLRWGLQAAKEIREDWPAVVAGIYSTAE